MTSDVLILIPARMASARLPGKPLADIGGLPMIVRVMRRAEEAGVGPVVVATDSNEIASAVTAAGGRAVMTRGDHQTGSDRIFEALGKADPDGRAKIVVNVQGDFPDPERRRHQGGARTARRPGGRHRDAGAGNHRRGRAHRSERRQGDLLGRVARDVSARSISPARPRHTGRRAALSPHRPLCVSPRGAGALRHAAALAARDSASAWSSCARSKPACASTWR